MTKKAASNLRFLATDHELDESGHGLFERDQTGRAKLGIAGVSDVRRSEEIQELLAWIDAVMAREDATVKIYFGTPEDEEKVLETFQWVGLSPQEARAWQLYCAGFTFTQISRWMDRAVNEDGKPLTVSSVRVYVDRGRTKLGKVDVETLKARLRA